jgi:hypothetical protein
LHEVPYIKLLLRLSSFDYSLLEFVLDVTEASMFTVCMCTLCCGPTGRTLASSNEIWTYRVAPIDQGPTPSTYMMDNVFGMHQPVRHEPPSFTMGRKGTSSLSVKKEKMLAPGPDQYSVSESDEFVFHKWPSYSIGCKRTPNKGPSPGPAQYSPNYNYTQAHGPQYSMSRHTKHVAGLKC